MQINDGAMNRYADVSNAKGLTMGYFDISGTYQWKLAKQFTLGDAMFHSAFGGSFLNHAFLVCSCAFRWPNAPAGDGRQAGCQRQHGEGRSGHA